MELGVLYTSGNSGQMGLTQADGEACIAKPYRAADVVRALEIVDKMVRTGAASRPFPKGFHATGYQDRPSPSAIPIDIGRILMPQKKDRATIESELGTTTPMPISMPCSLGTSGV